jgi:hypothetical protein
MIFNLVYIEWHSPETSGFFSKQEGARITGVDTDGWNEFEFHKQFEAKSIAEAKKKALELVDNSSGVFSVSRNGKQVFTEEDVED